MGSLDSRARRVRKLEALDRAPARPPTSRTLEEARAIDAEIKRLDQEIRALGMDPSKCARWIPGEVPLDQHIRQLEAEIAREEAGA